MEVPLVVSATLLGLAGAPHCAAMCSAPCAAATGRQPRHSLVFHLARVGSYALGGAVVASSVAALAAWSALSPALRPLWVLLHAGALALGLWLLIQARQPAWMERLGRVPAAEGGLTVAAGPSGGAAPAPGWQRLQGPAQAGAAGALWVAWPCGLLQSALLVAALGSSAATGAAAMAGFALASAPGLLFGPWLLQRLLRGQNAAARERLAVRAAGLMLVAAAAWALGHGVWHEVAAFCGLA
ncbi:sulfite exporter TauE/SafE family protein [Rubrivivax rivuli]|uniref:Sulfite exporter TauE/SafE family protein n=1 Tax=Rubrivivax rivuli TaxID=1862385 RepID=A0A437RFT1_9BURK|nr:sulfite exporter TauE/SafE family protein [Rubrivivax rivuli]RVU45574.1 sulfite exporter TauE/SafE family protein [Rubrivivax rivuli]